MSLAALAVALLGVTAWAQNFERGPARSPHGAIAIPCGSCHTSTSWSPLRSLPEFSHSRETRFPLRGLHENVECRLCHTKLTFTNVGTKCADCHADIHRRQFGAQCEQCHTVKGWNVAVQGVRTHQNRFPLLGAHAAADCESCHKGAASGQYTGQSTDCVSCHLKDYQQTKPLNHQASGLPLTCAQCHGFDSFRNARFDHVQFARFPLEGAHTKLDCSACHKGGVFQGTPTDCFGCHSQQFASSQNPDHVRAGFSRDCFTCHTKVNWSGARFEHAVMTKFQLTGAHLQVACASCHVGGRFAGTRSDCYGCHLANYEAVKNPDHVRSNFATDCARCHQTDNWQGARFDHGLARFQLTGAHVQVACAQCHVGGKYTGTQAQCSGCHLTDFNKTANPNHVTAGFPQDCAVCHATAQWQGAKFDHSAKTKFPLTGAHVQASCSRCHSGGVFAGTSNQCSACHLTDFQKTANPNHASAGFPQDCTGCHTTAQWQGAKFDHSAKTKFPLTGAHVPASCSQCHGGGTFAGTSSQCSACHLTDFQKSTNPNHASAGFPQDCTACHTTAQWQGAKFDHSAKTKFPLTGAHVQASCSQCHGGGTFAGTSNQCSACHLADFQKTANPNHASAGFPQDCTACHTTARWQGAAFNHGRTKFALAGAHVSLSCNQCHSGGIFAGTSTQCAGCHLANYQKTTNPNHIAAGFPQDCAVCHTPVRWQGAVFDHGARTRFALTGAHVSASCSQCHSGGTFAGTNAQCSGCHLTDYQRTANPNHAAAGFPQDCAVCHTTARWQGAAFDHGKTRFALTGAHGPLSCNQCHSGGLYAGTNPQCSGCHLTSYQKSTNPNHAAAGFPQDCAVCHTTARWAGAVFNHSTGTRFPLTGAHLPLACSQCHSGGNYAGTSAQCSTCHFTNYQKTTNPNHAAAGFPQDCAACHTTARWTGATFNHSTKFALTGAHASASCSQCHSGGVYAGIGAQCSGCHLTNYQRTTNPNHATAGFPQDCAACHTTARWTGASFNHSTRFALTGAHASVACSQCHSKGYAGTSAQCSACHLANYQRTTNPNHVTAGFPQDCSTCHTTARWTGASFNHSARFALTGAHASAACSQCHSGGTYAGTSAQCSACHLASYQRTTNPNHAAAGFPQDCSACHTTVRWTGATFNHSTGTRFALTGAHASVACSQCHSSGVYRGTTTQCSGCHLTNYQRTTNPNHATAGFPQDCSTCHTTARWTGATFNHSTRFALTGAHASVACSQCHSKGYAGTSAQCSACHLASYQRTTNPNHAAAGFPQDCSTCHTTARWTGATFNHSTGTRFALTGAHASVACSQCHSSGVYRGTTTQCSGCHLTNYQRTTNPNHATAGFPQDCSTCHTTARWTGATFNHSTRFALTGAHASAACSRCHSGGVYAGLSTACATCHLATYQRTTNPNHAAAGFPQDCSVCHTTTGWAGASFNHSRVPFPLVGRHTSVACSSCHSTGVYVGLSTACSSCHLASYQRTTNPNHATAGFPQQCDACHTPSGWTPASFNHATKFALTGRHSSVACASCHVGGRYTGTPTDCYSCHKAIYDSTTNPGHKAAGFPTTCQSCHTTAGWAGATFNHTYFPVPHNSARLCNDCHTNPSSYSAFVCTSCHTKASTDSHHQGRQGYVYNSANCYQCHPRGRS